MSCVTVNHVWTTLCTYIRIYYRESLPFVHFICNEPSACVVTYAQHFDAPFTLAVLPVHSVVTQSV